MDVIVDKHANKGLDRNIFVGLTVKVDIAATVVVSEIWIWKWL